MFFHFKITLRNLRRGGVFSAINIIGLATGMAVAGFIALWIYGAVTFDAYHTFAKDTYIVTYTMKFADDGAEVSRESAPYGLVPVLEQIADVRSIASVMYSDMFSSARIKEQVYSLPRSTLVSPDWFTVFDYILLDGSLNDFGADPFCAVLTSSEARRLFGVEKAAGEVFMIGEQSFTVRAVVKDPPQNSSFQFHVIFPIEAEGMNPDWKLHKNDPNYYTASFFVLLSKNADKTYITQSINQYFKANNWIASSFLLSLKNMRLDNRISEPDFPRGDSKTINLLAILAVLLLVVACLNYVNLTTARFHVRTKEIDIKKIFGAKSRNLFRQMMCDTLLTSLIAALCALALIIMLTPFFEKFFNFSVSWLKSPVLWLVFAAVLGFTTLLSGVYPAILLSSLKPFTALRGRNILGAKSGTVRRVLVVFQFVASAGLILGMLTLSQQMRFIRNSDTGYDRNGVVAIEPTFAKYLNINRGQATVLLQSIKAELQTCSSIESVSLASTGSIAMVSRGINGGADWDGYDDSDRRYSDFRIKISNMNVDADYLQTLRLTMMQGRWFDRDNAADRNNVIVNEAAIRELNIAAPYIGQRFSIWGQTGQIIGIVKDFHFNGFHHKIGPMVLSNSDDGKTYIVFKSHSGKMPEAVKAAKQIYANFFPGLPFDAIYTEDVFNNLYKDDDRIAQMVTMLGLLATLISCLGLFGLVTFTAETKNKEIGIRKVLGASVSDIVGMLTREFLILVGIAMLIAFPIAYYWLNKLLLDYAYRITIGWQIFGLSAIITLALMFVTVGWKAVKAATANPAKSISNSE